MYGYQGFLHAAPRVLLVAGLLATVAGCGDNPRGRLPVSGTVSFHGQPLERGTIDFQPLEPAGVPAGASIENGSYQIAEARGLPPGKYQVRIFSSEEDTRLNADGTAPGNRPPAIERLPPEFNVATRQSAEVTADGKNVFDFQIP